MMFVSFLKCKRTLSNGMDIDDHKIRVPSLLWIPLVICAGLLFFVDVFQIQYYSLTPARSPFKEFSLDQQLLAGFAINTPGCRIPFMDPFDKNVMKFVKTPKLPKCNNGIPALFESNLTSIYLVNSSLQFYNVTDMAELKCCYKVFWRIDPKTEEYDDKIESGALCFNFSESTHIHDEFIKITCDYYNSTIYQDMFAFVPLKDTRQFPKKPRPPSVLIIGLDAVSRLNLHRQMPNTARYLKHLEAVELLGYNKVEDNTFPNLIPVLTGLNEPELRKTCWPSSKHHFDRCPFIWNGYKESGYLTAYGEDSSWMGLFNYQRRGFRYQPTDYGYNYFSRLSEKVLGNCHNMNVNECVGARYVYQNLLDYINKFVTTMDGHRHPYFGFFWGSSLSHDYLNKPKLGDWYYYNFFKSLKDQGHLNNTVLIFMSDHGIRWGDIRQTYQGRMEERLPFVIIYLPKWYKQRYLRAYRNLQRNSRRLTTPYDLHETLKDLLQPFNLTDENLDTFDKSRGYSLFREISGKRTCDDAGIASHWCTCQQSLEVDKNTTVVVQGAAFAVEYINSQLEGYAQCANLSLDAILNARLMTHGSAMEGENKINDYMVTVQTLPGGGIFEVTVRHSENEETFNVMGTVSRLNLYGKQSLCISDFHLKLYCYCKGLF